MLSYFGWGTSSQPDSTTTAKPQEKAPSNQQPSATSQTQAIAPPAAAASSDPQPQPQLSHPLKPQDKTNIKLLAGGLAFSLLSIWITRRASLKKRIACIPPFYSSSVYFQPKVNGAMEAFEALNLATINVFSFGMLTTGAAMYALDVNGVEDMRRMMRSGLEGTSAGKSDEELENEVTEWVASVLGDRFEKQLEKERAKKRQDGEGGPAGKGN